MTRIFNDATKFAQDMTAGFVDIYSDYVVAVPGGVVRAQEPRQGKVAVVVGGGSGHYPAFAGVVGPGFADGSVIGNVFTSPSAADVVGVGVAASAGGGVVLTTGNYAGDVLNFNEALRELESRGIPTGYVAITDDVASAPASEIEKRRGIAGDFPVFKTMAAAAEAGADLDEVERIGNATNDVTRSLGVAFSGCTLPGSSEPLFTIPDNQMSLGLGIHGEPGISEHETPSANELAQLLVDGLLRETPSGSGNRVAAILNGLGSTKYEELFILWREVAALLRQAGLELVQPEVGELVTSLDMAGCSLTLTWLDEELEKLWCAPADTPAFKRGIIRGADEGATLGLRRNADEIARVADADVIGEASAESQRAAKVALASLEAIHTAMCANEADLGHIDAVAGDGDHGRGMVNGSRGAVEAAAAAVAAQAGLQSTLDRAGRGWAAVAGGTSGVLWGRFLRTIGESLDDASTPAAEQVARALSAGLAALMAEGGAQLGDKTMLDAISPFVLALQERVGAGESLTNAWAAAAPLSQDAAAETAKLRPKVGRARPLAEKSLGTPDAGAVSFGICAAAVAGVLQTTRWKATESD